MPIVPNTLTQQSNSLFRGFTPYELPTGTVVCDLVSDMVSVDLVPATPSTQLTYNIGTENTYTQTLSVKNLTNNTALAIELVYDKNVFNMEKDTFELTPTQETTIGISLNKAGMNTLTGLSNEAKTISLKVTNLNNGQLINKNSTVSPYIPRSLPETIVVI